MTEQPDSTAPAEELPGRLVLWFDGLTEPRNPGGWGCYGWALTEPELAREVATGKGVAARPGPGSTNNVAEYTALGMGLRWLADRGWHGEALKIRGDSKLVVCQLTGAWACHKAHLQKLRDRCLELLDRLADDWAAVWVPRDKNTRADELSRLAYEEATGKKCPERGQK